MIALINLVVLHLIQDSFDMPMLDDWSFDEIESSTAAAYVMSSSDGEDSDGEVFLTPVNDLDLPSVSSSASSNNDALTVAAHRFASLSRERKKHRQVCTTYAYGFVLYILYFSIEILDLILISFTVKVFLHHCLIIY